jgi:hypothetical protein
MIENLQRSQKVLATTEIYPRSFLYIITKWRGAGVTN